LDAARAILALEDFEDATAQATITEYIEDNTPKAKSAPAPKATAKAAPKAKAVKTAKVTEDEDAPF
jgi:hypothetical protein